MSKISNLKFLLLIALAFVSGIRTIAQVEEVGNMIAAGGQDAKLLLQPYIAPAINGFGAAQAGGWYNTAEPHKLGGFDITFTANVAMAPKKYSTFVINNDELSALKLQNPSLNETQTVLGDNIDGPQLVYNVTDNEGNVIYTQNAFRMPQGLNMRYVPSPMVQAGIGLIKGTEVMVRFMPNISIEGNELGLWGIGGKHDIKQWIPGLKKLPVLKVSVMYGYTKLHTFIGLNVDPESINAGGLPEEQTNNNWEDQYMKLRVKSHTANLLIGADLKVVSFYGGIGFVSSKSTLKMEGDFPYVGLTAANEPVVKTAKDPIDMEIENKDGSFTKPRLNVGVRFKMAIVTLHFDYSWANYSVLTAGLGFSFR
jgi:hypothetical protein